MKLVLERPCLYVGYVWYGLRLSDLNKETTYLLTYLFTHHHHRQQQQQRGIYSAPIATALQKSMK